MNPARNEVRFTPKYGWLVYKPDPDISMHAGLVHYSDNMKQTNTVGTCMLHNPTAWWDAFNEGDLTGKVILVEKWAWKKFTLNGETLYLVPERGVLGIFVDEQTGEDQMTRKELLEELQERVKNAVADVIEKDDDEVTEEHVDEIDGLIGETPAADILAAVDEEEADAEEEEE